MQRVFILSIPPLLSTTSPKFTATIVSSEDLRLLELSAASLASHKFLTPQPRPCLLNCIDFFYIYFFYKSASSKSTPPRFASAKSASPRSASPKSGCRRFHITQIPHPADFAHPEFAFRFCITQILLLLNPHILNLGAADLASRRFGIPRIPLLLDPHLENLIAANFASHKVFASSRLMAH